MILLKLTLYFAVVIGVLYLAYYATKMIGKTAGARQASANIQVLEKVVLTKDSFLLIVRIQDKVTLLGVTPGGISKLDELDGYEEGELKITEDFGTVFAKQLKNNLTQMGKNVGRKKGDNSRRGDK